MRTRRSLLCLFALVAALVCAVADEEAVVSTELAPPFRDGAVLQRGAPIPVWGTADPGASVVLFFDRDLFQTTADAEGRWKVEIPAQNTPGTGHHITLVTNGRPFKTYEDIAIGDVWLCAGADDMEGSFYWAVHNGEEELKDAEYPDMRLYLLPRDLSAGPCVSYPAGRWMPYTRDVAVGSSALAFLFGRRIHTELGVPVGIVLGTRSGTPVKAWLPLEAAEECPALAEEAAARAKALRAWHGGGMLAFQLACNAWDDSNDGSDPFADASVAPYETRFVEKDWATAEVPSTVEDTLDSPAFNGFIWYRRTVFLTADQAARKATLCLGAVDDKDTAWVNGVEVGSSDNRDVHRRYEIPEGTLHAGSNLLAVRVEDLGGTGGLSGDASEIALRFDDGTDVDLTSGLWSLKVNKAPKGYRPVASVMDEKSVGICFDSMPSLFTGATVRGVLWAQGPGDADAPDAYGETLRALIASWRERFQGVDGDVPFYILQTASHRAHHDGPVESGLAAIRWAQTQVGESVPGCGTATSLDDGSSWADRSFRRRDQADRLADLALSRTYGREGEYRFAPVPEAATLRNGKVVVAFRGEAALATADGKVPAGFQLAAKDRAFVWAEAALGDDGKSVVLDLPKGMDEPAFVRHAWDDYPARNLVGEGGEPCGSFELPVGGGTVQAESAARAKAAMP